MRAQYLSYANYIIMIVDALRNGDEYIKIRDEGGKELEKLLLLIKK